MPNFLVMDSTTGAGGTCRAYLYANGTPTQIGDTFGTSQPASNPPENFIARNEIVQFDGDLYAQAHDGIYKKDDPTSMAGAWTIAHAWTQNLSTYRQAVGLYIMGGDLYAIGGDDNAGANTMWWAKFDGTTWTQAVSGQFTGTHTGTYEAIVYHDTLYVYGGFTSTETAWSFDAASTTFTYIGGGIGAANHTPHGFCVFEDRLFCIAVQNNSNWGLFEFTGSWGVLQSWDSSFGPIPSGTEFYEAKWALFTDGTTMTALVASTNSGFGWLAFEWDTSLVRTEITAAGCLPAGLQHSGTGGSYGNGINIIYDRIVPVYDLNSVVGTTDIYLFRAGNGNSGTAFTVYKWNSNSVEMTVVDSGGNAFHALPTHLSLGERIFTAGELDVRITARIGVIGGEKISFTVHGGGTGRRMRMHHLLQGTPPLVSCSLVGPVTGGSATIGVDQVENIDADGVTVYTVVWNAAADGLSTANRVIRAPEALV